jgi:hypothetical protein
MKGQRKTNLAVEEEMRDNLKPAIVFPLVLVAIVAMLIPTYTYGQIAELTPLPIPTPRAETAPATPQESI